MRRYPSSSALLPDGFTADAKPRAYCHITFSTKRLAAPDLFRNHD